MARALRPPGGEWRLWSFGPALKLTFPTVYALILVLMYASENNCRLIAHVYVPSGHTRGEYNTILSTALPDASWTHANKSAPMVRVWISAHTDSVAAAWFSLASALTFSSLTHRAG